MSERAFGSPKSEFELGEDDLQLSDYERRLARKILRPETFLQIDDRVIGYLAERLIIAGLNLPISQIQGFSDFPPQMDSVTATESTTSTLYTNLATAGPSITGLPNGSYLVIVAAALMRTDTAGQTAFMSISVNGASAADNDAAATEATSFVGGIGITLQTLSSGNNNTITAKYRSTNAGATASFARRRLIVLKAGNI